jgi:outer membrane protein assembly factor BamA
LDTSTRWSARRSKISFLSLFSFALIIALLISPFESYAQGTAGARPKVKTQGSKKTAKKKKTDPAKLKDLKLPGGVGTPTGITSDILREASEAAKAGKSVTNIAEVKVEGTKKIEADAVMARIQTKAGTKLDATLVRQDVDTLFKTGLFYDVQVSKAVVANGLLLTYRVVEKPAVVEINF